MTESDWKKLIGKEVEIPEKPKVWSNVRPTRLTLSKLKNPLNLKYPLKGVVISISRRKYLDSWCTVSILIEGKMYGFSTEDTKVKLIELEKFKVG